MFRVVGPDNDDLEAIDAPTQLSTAQFRTAACAAGRHPRWPWRCVALFVALSGGAYAAATLPAHSVGATQLKSFAVTNPKLGGVNSVGSRKIMPGAVGFYRVNRTEVQLRLKNACASGPGDHRRRRQRQCHLRAGDVRRPTAHPPLRLP